MPHELKVILGDTINDVNIYVDNQRIGMIQDIKVHAGVHQQKPEIEIVFPDLRPFRNTNKDTVEALEKTLDLFKDMPNVKVTIAPVKIGRP